MRETCPNPQKVLKEINKNEKESKKEENLKFSLDMLLGLGKHMQC